MAREPQPREPEPRTGRNYGYVSSLLAAIVAVLCESIMDDVGLLERKAISDLPRLWWKATLPVESRPSSVN